MSIPEIVGLTGAIIAGAAYFPQIIHLVKEQCSAGISSGAFTLWLISAILVTISAVYLETFVFIFLGAVQITATAIVLLLSVKYRGQSCPSHKIS